MIICKWPLVSDLHSSNRLVLHDRFLQLLAWTLGTLVWYYKPEPILQEKTVLERDKPQAKRILRLWGLLMLICYARFHICSSMLMPVNTVSVLLPHLPLSTKQGCGGRYPRILWRNWISSSSSSLSTSFFPHCLQSAHLRVVSTMKHWGTLLLCGFELSTASHAIAGCPSSVAASQGIGSSFSKATIRFHTWDVLALPATCFRTLSVAEACTILYPDLHPRRILLASNARTTASKSPRPTSVGMLASSGLYRICPAVAA